MTHHCFTPFFISNHSANFIFTLQHSLLPLQKLLTAFKSLLFTPHIHTHCTKTFRINSVIRFSKTKMVIYNFWFQPYAFSINCLIADIWPTRPLPHWTPPPPNHHHHTRYSSPTNSSVIVLTQLLFFHMLFPPHLTDSTHPISLINISTSISLLPTYISHPLLYTFPVYKGAITTLLQSFTSIF